MKDLCIEPKLIDLGNGEIRKDEKLINYNDKTHKNVKRGLKTDATGKNKGKSN